MLRLALLLIAATLYGAPALASGIPQPGDFYLISRDRFGSFVGSHKLFLEYAQGLKQVRYCNRNYYVRSHSVAWTQLETEFGHSVRIEYNFGKGWRPICEHPEQHVTLADLGIEISAEDVLAGLSEEDAPQSRLSAIGAVFQSKKPQNKYSSYHKR